MMFDHTPESTNTFKAVEVKQTALSYHQAGLNGAQALLQALMDHEIIPDMPHLVEMTSTWKGGIGGETCSAYAAATMAIGSLKEDREEKLLNLQEWFKENFGSISCPMITEHAGGRPSQQQKSYCDQLTSRTAEFVSLLSYEIQTKKEK